MRFQAVLRFLVAAALLGATQAARAHAAYAYPRCPAGRPRLDALSCYYSVPRQCWVTESGLGVCAPIRNGRTTAV
jgi:hypothetical protein